MAISFTSSGKKAIEENLSANAVVYVAKAVDSDNPTLTFTYSLDAGSDSAVQINGITGEVSLSVATDYESQQAFKFTVIATPGNGGQAIQQAVALEVVDAQELISGTAGDDQLAGTLGSDLIQAGTGNDTVQASLGSDSVDGGVGFDTAIYSGPSSDYRLSTDSGALLIESADGLSVDRLERFEAISFSDGEVQVNYVASPEQLEFQLNEVAENNQQHVRVAALNGGGFIAVWQSDGADGSGTGIVGRLLDASGVPSGSEFQINTTTTGDQTYPEVTGLLDGGFVVAWKANNSAIAFQRFESAGQAVGEESTSALGNGVGSPDVTSLPDGGFVVAWQSGSGIFAQGVGASGDVIGTPTLLSPGVNERNVAISSLSGSSFVAVWGDRTSGLEKTYLQKFELGHSGIQGVGDPILVSGRATEVEADVAGLANGKVVVTWFDHETNGIGYRVLDNQLDPLTSTQYANAYTYNGKHVPSVAALDDGGFALVWQSSGEWDIGDGYDVFLRLFDGEGNARWSRESLLNTSTDNRQTNAAVAVSSDTVLGLWESQSQDGSGQGLFGQAFKLTPSYELNNNVIGGLGDDVIDGGSGYNYFTVEGTPDAFMWFANDRGEIELIDQIADSEDPVNGADLGSDTLTNIQGLRFRNPVTNEVIDIELDDYGNSRDAGNYLVGYGELVTGRFNFKGDVDYFLLDVEDGTQVKVTSYINNHPNYHELQIGSINTEFSHDQGDSQARSFSLSGDGLQDLILRHSFENPGNSSSPQATQAYSFVIRRFLEGTDNADTLNADGTFEWVEAGGGDDIVSGTAGSDALYGEAGNDTLTGGAGNDYLYGGSGTANVAVFSGAKAEYTFSWQDVNGRQAMVLQDLVSGRDGRDYLHDIQVLRFSDGDVVLDRESNERSTVGYSVGQSIAGSFPVTPDWREVDQDWFQQIFTPAVGPETVLRVRFEVGQTSQLGSWRAYVQFFATGSDDRLLFSNPGDSNSNVSEFQLWSGQKSVEYFVTPSRFSSGGDFAALFQRLDVRVAGRAQNGQDLELGDLLPYTLTLDIVLLGDEGSNTLVGDGNATFLDGKGGDDVLTGSDKAETLQGGAGTDSLAGNGGDDRLLDFDTSGMAQGPTPSSDSYSGGAGNDVIDISNSTFLISTAGQEGSGVTVTIDGGEEAEGDSDRDVLILPSADVAWGLLDVSNVEVLEAEGVSSASVSELLALGFKEGYGMTFVVADGATEDFSGLGGAYVVAAGAGSVVTGPADGVELRVGAAGATFAGGDGADTVRLEASSDLSLGAIPLAQGTYATGLGVDTLHLEVSGAIDISALTLTGIDRLTGIFGQTEVSLTVAQLLAMSRVDNVRTVVLVGGGAVDLAELAARNVKSWRLGDSESYTITGTDAIDNFEVQDASYAADLGAGDDVFEISASYGSSSINSLEGGAGTDTLRVLSGDVDLSGITLTGIEAIEVSSSSLAMTDSQWQTLGGLVTRTEGSETQFILSLTAPGEYAMAADSPYYGLSGSTGADRLTGNDANNAILGGAGDDTLIGLAGSDRLVTGAGSDTVAGGAGDDRIEVTGKALVTDSLDGGEGNDVLVALDGQDFTGATLAGIETLRGTGTVTLTQGQLESLSTLDGITVRLSGAEAAYQQGTLTLLNGARVVSARLLGTALADNLSAPEGDQTVVGGVGDDFIDGGSGFNYAEFAGTPDAFTWQANSQGQIIVTDFVADQDDPVNGADLGVDTLTNIQGLRFRNPVTNEVIDIELDDYGNSRDAGNHLVSYGELITGRFNFKGDVDHFLLDVEDGTQVKVTSYINNDGNYHQLQIGSDSANFHYAQGDSRARAFNLSGDGLQDLILRHYFENPGNSSSPQATQAYSFVIRRFLEGTDNADTLNADGTFEWVEAGGGDDTVSGTAGSDALYGEAGNDTLTGGAGNDYLYGGSGTANVAVFSGAKAEYTFSWQDVNGRQAMVLQDLVSGRDGRDYLHDIQVLRFSDGDVVLDRESNERSTVGYSVGQSITGSLPITADWREVDQDWFQQILTPAVKPETVLRVRFEVDPVTQVSDWRVYAQFFASGSNDRLLFSYADNPGNTLDQFQIYPWEPSQEFFVVPTRFSSGGDFAALFQRLDVRVTGRARNDQDIELGDLLPYTLTLDIVLLGDEGSNTLVGDGNATFLDGKGGDDVLTGSDKAETLQGGAGTDSLAGNGGDDRLLDFDTSGMAQGPTPSSDSYSGGAGNDVIDISNSTFLISTAGQEGSGVTVTIDGGEEAEGDSDRDVLILPSADVAWGLLDVSNVEVLEAEGVSSASVSELLALGFKEGYGMTFVVADGATEDFSGLGGAYVVAAGAGSVVTGPADGVELRVGAAGATFAGGDGADTVRLEASSDLSLGAIPLAQGTYATGLGVDTLHLEVSGAIDISALTLTGIDRLTGIFGQTEVSLTVAQLLAMSRVDNVKTVVLVGGGAVDLAELAARNVKSWRLGDGESYTITGTDAVDSFEVQDANYAADLGAGDDVFEISASYGSSSINSLEGGAGTDTLRVLSGDVDLSGVTLTGVEAIEVSSSSLAMTDSQWQTLGGLVTRTEGSETQFILSLTAPGEYAMAADSPFLGLSGSSGADKLIGNVNDDVLSGGAGNDILQGGEGNDRLVAGAGVDRLFGEAGDDVLDVTGKANLQDVLDGGAGRDVLVVSPGQDLSGATLAGIEVLRGSGVVTLTLAQLQGLSEIDGVTVQLAAEVEALSVNPALRLLNGASIRSADFDDQYAGTGILGTVGSDAITGSDNTDIIFGGRGSDTLDGRGGNDTLYGGRGSDTLIGGAGDDQLIFGGEAFINEDNLSGDRAFGGAGSDTLVIDLGDGTKNWGSYRILEGTVSGVEALRIVDTKNSYVYVPADIWNNFDSVDIPLHPQSWNLALRGLNISGGGLDNLSFSSVSASSFAYEINLTGAFDAIDLTRNPAINSQYAGDQWNRVYVDADFGSLTASADADRIQLRRSGEFNVSLGGGDDTLYLDRPITGRVDGGEGTDTLDVRNVGLINLANVTLTGIESVYHGSASIIVTEAQQDALSFDGSGRVYLLTDGVVIGTDQADNYSGTGFGAFQGGGGDDSLFNITTAVFTGNSADYDWSRSGSTLTIQHSRGTLLDGTDSLSGVLEMRFADTTVQLDDAHSELGYFIDGWSFADASDARDGLATLQYGKREAYKKDFQGDQDVFKMTLVPNSPLNLEASTPNGNTVWMQMVDAATGQQIFFEHLEYGWRDSQYYTGGVGDARLPVISTDQGWVPYAGGEVVVTFGTWSDEVEDYAFTINYQDDYAGSIDTLGEMDPQEGVIKGYVGDIGDSDWIRTELIAGTKYQFSLRGLASGGGTLVDPKLELRDSEGRLLENGVEVLSGTAGTDDTLVFRPTETGTYYLAVSDIIGQSKGSWTLSQESLDTIAGNVSTTERLEFSSAGRFRVESEINQLSDHDWFKVWLDKGITYNFTLDGTSLGATLDDPLLAVRSVTGRLLAQDDNGGTGKESDLYFSAPDSGWYFLDAGAAGNGSRGTYVLQGSTLLDDFDNTILTEGSVTLDAPVSGVISYLGDSDWFKVGLSKSVTYLITLKGDISEEARLDPLLDPFLVIRDEEGRIIERIDDFAGSLDATAFFRPSSDGVYFLEARSAFKYDIGAYALELAFAPPDDHGDLFDATATPLSIQSNFKGSAQGNLGTPGDKDVFAVALAAGKVYRFEAKGFAGGGGTLADPLLRVFTESGRLADFNDNGGLGNDSALFFVPDFDGTFYLEVSSANRDAMGTFTVALEERNTPPDDVPNDLSTDVVLTPGESISRELLLQNDQDWFAIDLTQGNSYVFRVQGARSGGGSLADPLLELRDDTGSVVRLVDDMLVGNEPAIQYTPAASGRFYLVVRASDGQTDTGTYTLTTRAPDDHGNTKATATALSLDDVVEGGIQYNDGAFGVRAFDSVGLATDFDEDWFSFQATEGQVLSFNAELAAGSILSRPLVEVMDGQGRILAVGDGLETDGGLAAAAFLAPATGTYYARVIDGAGATGTYLASLSLGDASDEDASGPVQLALTNQDGVLQVSQSAIIGLSGDTDTFEVALQSGHSYRIETVALRDGSMAPLPSAALEMDFTQAGGGLQNDAIQQQLIDNGDGTYTVEFRISEALHEAWAGDLNAVQLSLSAAPSVFGALSEEDVAVADGGLARASVTDSGSIELQITFPSAAFVVDGADALASLTFTAPPAALADATVGVGEVRFNATAIDPVTNVTSPSFFDQGFVQAGSDGVLSITVAPLEATQTGQYRLRVIDLGVDQTDDHPNAVADFASVTDVLAINENASGRIDAQDDVDLFPVNLTAGNIYDFSVKSFLDGLGSLAQAELRLLNAEGQLISLGRYDGVTGRAELSVAVFDDGRYYLEVAATDVAGNIGTYMLDTRLRGNNEGTVDDFADNTLSSAVAGPGQPLSGEIEVAGDRDWARVSLEAGKVYIFDALGDGDGAGGTLSDGVLRVINSQGEEVAFDDNMGAGLDAHIQFSPGTSGDYYLEISGKGAAKGTYTLRVRELYSGLADPMASAQWYIDQSNILELDGIYTGAGVSVSVIDDGIDMAHPDLQENMDFARSYDTQFDTRNGNPKYPRLVGPPDNHGTQVAGIIGAVQNNETGIRGSAPDVELVSTRVKWSWGQITEALNRQWEFDVSNNSWGAIEPFSDNFNSTALTFAWVGIRKGVEEGREGLGTVFVFSAGNGAAQAHNTNYFNFQNAREVIAVGAANQDDTAAAFSTPGANVLVSTYGVDMITTDRHQQGWGVSPGDYASSFSGTSASAPLVSGVVALMLEANPELGYRDVQEILAYSTRHPEVQDWKENGAQSLNLGGLRYNDKAGFGLVDAYAAVQLAKTWLKTSTSVNEAFAGDRAFGLSEAIPDGTGEAFVYTFEIDSNLSVEHVELGIDLRHTRLGDLEITLTSPDGTTSLLMDRPTVTDERPFGLSGQDSGVPTHLLWDFSSVQFWGEKAAGTWTVTVRDIRAEQTGSIQSLSLRVFGAQESMDDLYVFTDEGFLEQGTRILEDERGVDTVNASALRFDSYIDLTAGVIAANTVSYGIADWTVIENAFTGRGNDRLVGNDANNILRAGAGNDVLEGMGGDDRLFGGLGQDTAVFFGAKEGYSVSWDPDSNLVTVVDIVASDGDEGTNILSGIERLVFSDAEMRLGEMVGNAPPQANTAFFDTPVNLPKGMGIEYQLPDDAFVDDSGSSEALSIEVSDAAGGELPEWLSWDETTGTFVGVPPEDYQGQLRLSLTAVDEFGESVSEILTLQFGDNQAPIVDAPAELVLQEDSGLTLLGLTAPQDPEASDVTVTILDLPSFGTILDKAGNPVSVGRTLTADEFSELHYQTALDANGDAGFLRYRATDSDGVSAESSLHLFVSAVNDAPRFVTEGSALVINYPEESSVLLDLLKPSDPESELTTVKLIGLPELGEVTLDGAAVKLEQVLTFDQLERLTFTLSENVNGPIGAVTIQAVDPQGLATDWSLQLEVNGDSEWLNGTAGDDELFGSSLADVLYGNAGDDTIAGNAGDDRLLGGLGNDTLLGGRGDDVLDGSAGNDYLDGGPGDDFMAGGPGQDIYIVDSAGDMVLEVISGGAGGDDIIVTALSMTAPTNIEALYAMAGFAVDLVGNELDNVLVGNEEPNRLEGGRGRDTLFGEGGDDVLDGGAGVDAMVGGEGDDTYYVDSRADRVLEAANAGIDFVIAATSYTLPSNVEGLIALEGGNYTLGGNSLDNTLIGNSGNNLLAGGLGADRLEGGLGDDVYVLSDHNDTIIDTGGIDTVRSALDITLQAGMENAELVGVADTVAIGNAADNRLVGNMADNILDGRGGVDTLIGGAGDDQFYLAFNGADSTPDVVEDFQSGADLLVIDLASFGVSAETLGLLSSGLVTAEAFVTGAGARALDPDDHYLYDTATGILSFDVDGSGQQAPQPLAVVRLDEDSAALNAGDVFVAI